MLETKFQIPSEGILGLSIWYFCMPSFRTSSAEMR